jgi:hypothetical protein
LVLSDGSNGDGTEEEGCERRQVMCRAAGRVEVRCGVSLLSSYSGGWWRRAFSTLLSRAKTKDEDKIVLCVLLFNGHDSILTTSNDSQVLLVVE